MAENQQKTDKRLENLKRDAGPGRPKGQRNYATIYREALIKLATMNNMDPEEMETDILLKGLASARKGDYRFWKDLHDRLHGTAVNNLDFKSGGEKISGVAVTIKSDDNTEPTSE